MKDIQRRSMEKYGQGELSMARDISGKLEEHSDYPTLKKRIDCVNLSVSFIYTDSTCYRIIAIVLPYSGSSFFTLLWYLYTLGMEMGERNRNMLAVWSHTRTRVNRKIVRKNMDNKRIIFQIILQMDKKTCSQLFWQ